MKGVYSKHPLASWELLHEAEQALQDLLDDTADDAEVVWDEAAETLAAELAQSKSDAKTLLALLHDLGAIEVQPLFSEVHVSMSTQKCQHNRSEGQTGDA